MKTLSTIFKITILLFVLFQSGWVQSQTTTIYADTVYSFSHEYSPTNANCTSGWAACKIKGAPDTYPACGDISSAWAFPFANTRESMVVGYSTHLFADTIKIYETNHSGAVDTVYLRDAGTGVWHTVYSGTANVVTTCNIKTIGMTTTAYRADALRFAISNAYYPSFAYPEYDAVGLIGHSSMAGIDEYGLNSVSIYPNPGTGKFKIQSTDLKIQQVEVLNIVGEKVLQSSALKSQTENEIDISKLENGIYFVKIISGEKTITKKIVKQ